VLCQDLAGVFLDLAEGDGFKSTSALKAKAKSADTAEEIEDSELAHRLSPSR
jgi:hypothetical protein